MAKITLVSISEASMLQLAMASAAVEAAALGCLQAHSRDHQALSVSTKSREAVMRLAGSTASDLAAA